MTPDPAYAVADAFGGAQAVLFGRARSALLALFEALGLHARSTILIPSNACPSLLACAWASGARVRLATVSPDTGVNADDALAKQIAALAADGETGAVLLTHLYGFRLDFTQARKTAQDCGWISIENDANASSLPGRAPLADIARVVSFGAGKTLDAGAGGAVITDDPALAKALSEAARRYPPLDARAEETETALMLKRRALRNEGRIAAGEALLLSELAELRYGFPDEAAPRLNAALAAAADVFAERADRAALWRETLAPLAPHLTVIDLPQPAPWRLVARAAPEQRDRLVAALREAGFDAGTNYPALAPAFPTLVGDQAHPDAEHWERQVINLWLEKPYTEDRIRAAGAVLERGLETA